MLHRMSAEEQEKLTSVLRDCWRRRWVIIALIAIIAALMISIVIV
jgi:hypothetical protein